MDTNINEQSNIVPDSIEPVIGYRVWLIDRGGNLRSVTPVGGLALWPIRKPLKATCWYVKNTTSSGKHSSSLIPLKSCTCGIHAAKGINGRVREDGDILSSYLSYPYLKYNRDYYNSINLFGHATVIGEVYLWGRTLEGPEGYRSQYGYPKRLFPCNNPSIYFDIDRGQFSDVSTRAFLATEKYGLEEPKSLKVSRRLYLQTTYEYELEEVSGS